MTTGRGTRQQRRAALLDAAAEQFARTGWAETSIDQIARAAGVSAPVLYDHFGSKAGLFTVLLDRHVDALITRITRAVDAQDTAEGRLRASIGAFLDFVQADPFAWRTVFRDPPADPQIAERHQTAQDAATHLIAGMFIEGGAPAELEDDVTLVAQLFKSALNGLAVWWWEHQDLDRNHLVDIAHTALWYGIGAFPTTEQRPDAPISKEQ